jgi:hypothetical protein
MKDYERYEKLLGETERLVSGYETTIRNLDSLDSLGEKQKLELEDRVKNIALNLSRLETEKRLARRLASQSKDIELLEDKLTAILASVLTCEELIAKFAGEEYERYSIHETRCKLDPDYDHMCAQGEKIFEKHQAEKKKCAEETDKPYA